MADYEKNPSPCTPFEEEYLCPCAYACAVSVALAIHAFVWQHFKGSLQ